jgi:hypothetical protein
MTSKVRAPICAAVATALVLTSAPSPAVLPALLAKQVIHQVLQRELRQHLASAFTISGCKMPAHLAAFAPSAGALPGVAQSPALAGSALSALSGALPGKAGMLGSLGSFGIAHAKQLLWGRRAPSLPSVASAADNVSATRDSVAAATEGAAAIQAGSAAAGDAAPTANTAQAETGAAVGHLPAANAMQALVGGASAGGFGGLQMAAADPQVQSAMAAIGAAAAHPLSYEESMKVFDDLVTLKLLDPQHLAELQACSAAAGPQGLQALGQSAAIFKSTVLPPLMDAKARFAELTAPEQTELATQITTELERAPAKERQEFLDGFGTGLFPESVLQQVRAKLQN